MTTSIGFSFSIPAVAADAGELASAADERQDLTLPQARSTNLKAGLAPLSAMAAPVAVMIAPARSRGRARSPRASPDPAAGKAEQRASADATEHTEPNEATDPIEHAEPTEPIERKLPLHPIERNE